MQSLFVMNQSRYSSRRPQNLHLPRVNQTSYGLNSFRYEGAKLWNSLPEDIKSSENLITYKRLIKTWNGTTCRCSFCNWWDGDVAGKSIPTPRIPVCWGGGGGGGIGSLRAVCMIGEQCFALCLKVSLHFRLHTVFWCGCFQGTVCFNEWSVEYCYRCSEHVLFSCGMHGMSIIDSFQWYLVPVFPFPQPFSHGKLTANFLHEIKCRTAQFRVTFFQFIDEGWTFKVGKQK